MNKTRYVRQERVTDLCQFDGYRLWEQAAWRAELPHRLCSRHYGFGRVFWSTLALCYCHAALAGASGETRLVVVGWWLGRWRDSRHGWKGARG